MYPRLTLLLSCLLLWAVACTKAPANAAVPVLTPEAITVRGYFGVTRRTVVDFRLDGQPLDMSEVEMRILHDEKKKPAFDVTFAPLSEGAVIRYSPQTDTESNVLLLVNHRGHEYSVPLHGDPRFVSECEHNENACVTVRFAPESDQCEGTPLSDIRCESFDCANPGLCAAGTCVHREVEHVEPSCPRTAPVVLRVPTWVYTAPPNSSPTGALVLDEEANSYFFEVPAGEMVSLDGLGAVRWRKLLFPTSSIEQGRLDVRLFAQHLFVLDLYANRLWVLNRTDGTLLWENTFPKSTRMLPVGDELWALVGVHSPIGSLLEIFDASTGVLRETPPLPPVTDGGGFVYYDLVADEAGLVYFVGTNDVANPSLTGLAAMDPVTREPVWATSISLRQRAFSQPVARSGSMLLFQNGIAFDLETRSLYANETWQMDLPLLGSRSFVLNADGTGFRQRATRSSCSMVTLSHVNVRTGSPDWDCFLGSTATSGGILGRTESGSAVVLTIDVLDANLDPRLRIIDPNGLEQFHGVLSGGGIEQFTPPLLTTRGQRLLIRQFQSRWDQNQIYAYDIPELLTK